jgi:nitroimidazol reductase NimA-like FMN-containing flavoprotein (pyridoxamine 5'-phosphate oxidase superfamily)
MRENMTGHTLPPSERVRIKRLHQRGSYDRSVIDAILDATPVAHIGYNFGGAPYVTPTLHWREGDHLYWHGSAASRMLEAVEGAEVCVTATLIDGLVLGRSAFHHSVNYRSAMLFDRAQKIDDPAEKEAPQGVHGASVSWAMGYVAARDGPGDQGDSHHVAPH